MGTSESKQSKPKAKLKVKLGGKKKGKLEDTFTGVVPDEEEAENTPNSNTPKEERGSNDVPCEKNNTITDSWCEVNNHLCEKIEENDPKISAQTPSSSESHFSDAQTPLEFQNQSEESIDLDVEVRSSTIGTFLHDLTLNSFKLNEYSERHKKLSKLGVSKTSQISLDSNPDGCFASDNVEIVSQVQDDSSFADFHLERDDTLKRRPRELADEDTKVSQMVKRMSDVSLNNGVPEYRRHMSVPLDMTKAGQESEVLKKVVSLTLSKTELETKITKPKFVPEKLDFQLYEKFEGVYYHLARPKNSRRWWVRPIFQKRQEQGDFHNLIQEMRLSDQDMFFNYTRMTVEQFDELLALVGPLIIKKSPREPVPPAARLAITLRHLATGDGISTLAFAYRMGKSTVCCILNEIQTTFKAIN